MRVLISVPVVLLIFGLAACQQETADNPENSLRPFADRLEVRSLEVLVYDTAGFYTPYGLTRSGSGSHTWSVSGVWLPGGAESLIGFRLNGDNNRMLLYAGKEHDLVYYAPTDPGGTLPMQRPPYVSLRINPAANVQLTVDLSSMTYACNPMGATIVEENKIHSVHLVSDRWTLNADDAQRVDFAGNAMNRTGSTWNITLANLVPYKQVKFRFVLNSNTAAGFSKDPANPFTVGNNLLDSAPNPANQQSLTFIPTSEAAVISLNGETRTYTVLMATSPLLTDGLLGLLDTGLYGAPRIDNPTPTSGIRKLWAYNGGSAWHFALDGSFTNGIGLPSAGGIQFVLLIDDIDRATGLNGPFAFFPDMPPVAIPVDATVEYMVALESVHSPKASTDGPWALTEGGPRFVAGIAAGETNWTPFWDSMGKTHTLTPPSAGYDGRWGVFNHNAVYEFSIPRTAMPGTNLRFCVLAWSAYTNWRNSANTNWAWPIAEAFPPAANSNTLAPAGAWLTIP